MVVILYIQEGGNWSTLYVVASGLTFASTHSKTDLSVWNCKDNEGAGVRKRINTTVKWTFKGSIQWNALYLFVHSKWDFVRISTPEVWVDIECSVDVHVCVCVGGGAVAQSVESATPGQEVPGSIPAVAARWLGRCQYNVTGWDRSHGLQAMSHVWQHVNCQTLCLGARPRYTL